MNLPKSILRHIDVTKGALDDIGRSDATVLMFDDKVLKMQPICNVTKNELNMLAWLQHRLSVPQLIETDVVNDMQYLLMSRIPGHNLCHESILDDQETLVQLVADGLQKLWRVDVTACPTDRTLCAKFREIEEGIRNSSITMDTARQQTTYGPSGFKSPSELFDWLVKHQPAEAPVLSHGDYCLPNIICKDRRISGFIDLGCAGVADKWVDIEKVSWSLWANLTGQFGGKSREYNRNLLFEALGIQADEERIRYYSLLSELC